MRFFGRPVAPQDTPCLVEERIERYRQARLVLFAARFLTASVSWTQTATIQKEETNGHAARLSRTDRNVHRSTV
jgi:hypothetical protein